METYFDCTNCNTSIGLMYPGINDLVECPNCFTMHTIKKISPPELEFESDSFMTPDDTVEEIINSPGTNTRNKKVQSATTIKTPKNEGHYLCIPFNGFADGNDSTPGITLANQLEAILNEYHSKGWRFQKIDTVRAHIRAGLFGATHEYQHYDIIIFERSENL